MVPRAVHLAGLLCLVFAAVTSASASPRRAATGLIVFRCRDELCLMRPDGSGKRHILSVGPSPQWDPSVSPRTGAIAFRGYYGLGDGQYALYTVGTDGCGVRRLTRSIAGKPSWSPDGHWVAFDTSGGGEIWKVRPDGSGLTRITAGKAESPAWSPDGTRIAFVRHRSGRDQIWVMTADGSRAKLLHTEARAADEEPVWSHDGKKIAFVGSRWPRSWIEVMSADGTHVRALRRRGDPWNPVWLPGDAGIAFLARWDEGAQGLYVMRTDGSHVHRVASLSGTQFTWVGTRVPRRRCGPA
jgi:Tol biopolymer transport system component